MGFPIRKSADQSLFAAPRGFSQRTTSFIASQRQGIHRMPLRHLITLIVDARRAFGAQTDRQEKRPVVLRDLPDRRRLSPRIASDNRDMLLAAAGGIRTNLLFTMSRSAANPIGNAANWFSLRTLDIVASHCAPRAYEWWSARPPAGSARGRTKAQSVWRHQERSEWWSQTGSNRRPPACKAGALPTELWPRRRRHRAR